MNKLIFCLLKKFGGGQSVFWENAEISNDSPCLRPLKWLYTPFGLKLGLVSRIEEAYLVYGSLIFSSEIRKPVWLCLIATFQWMVAKIACVSAIAWSFIEWISPSPPKHMELSHHQKKRGSPFLFYMTNSKRAVAISAYCNWNSI